jgi:hypothetical protein
MPADIYVSLWGQVKGRIMSGDLACTAEIYDELTCLPGEVGECLISNEQALRLEVGDDSWDYTTYLEHVTRMQVEYAAFIRENHSGKKSTVGLNDLSIIALAKTLALPVVSMEKAKAHQTDKLRQIPDICALEKVPHMTFNDFLRAEGIQL